MMENRNWKEVKLEELIKFGNGKQRPDAEGLIPVYGGNGILSYTNSSNYDGETLIIGRVGAYCGAVYYDNRPIWISDNALSGKPKDNYDTKFLYYFLKNLDLNQFAGGSSHPLVTQTLLNSLESKVCINHNEQKAIASVLSSLDDKIDLLHQQNQTLEALAETLFRQWFIEEAKEDWEEKKLGDLIDIFGGYSYKGNKIGEGHSYLLGMGCVSFKDRFLYSGMRKYNEDVNTKYLVKKGDIVIATRQQSDNLPILGAPALIPDIDENCQVIVGTNLYKVVNNSNLNYYTLFKLLKSKDYESFIKSNAKGSTVRMITKDAILSFPLLMPPDYIIEKLNLELGSINNKIEVNINQIQTLTQLRDTLLPKLMSGEVRVNTKGKNN